MGGEGKQGRAYGILDAGRGLLAALLATAAVLLLHVLLPDDPASATGFERAHGLRAVIYAYTAVTAGAALLCWLFVPEREGVGPSNRALLAQMRGVVRLPGVWLQAIIVVCAWVRPIAAVGADWLGDRTLASRVCELCFALLIGSYLWLALAQPEPTMIWVLYANVLLTCSAVFGLRGVYFALFEEASVPLAAGWLLDRAPGVAGHQHFFMFLAASAVIGLLASVAFRRHARA